MFRIEQSVNVWTVSYLYFYLFISAEIYFIIKFWCDSFGKKSDGFFLSLWQRNKCSKCPHFFRSISENINIKNKWKLWAGRIWRECPKHLYSVLSPFSHPLTIKIKLKIRRLNVSGVCMATSFNSDIFCAHMSSTIFRIKFIMNMIRI